LGNLIIAFDFYAKYGSSGLEGFYDKIRIYTANRANGKWANTSYTKQNLNITNTGTTARTIPVTFASDGGDVTAIIQPLTLTTTYEVASVNEVSFVCPASDGSYWVAVDHSPEGVWIAAYGEENNGALQLECLSKFGAPAETDGEYEWDGTDFQLFDLVECGVANLTWG
jgi:hypothetical protein